MDDERQKLQDDLERYQTLRQLVTNQQASAVIEEQIRGDPIAWPNSRTNEADHTKATPHTPLDRSD
jgi:hypothetical protein